jgi:hypothetical protein
MTSYGLEAVPVEFLRSFSTGSGRKSAMRSHWSVSRKQGRKLDGEAANSKSLRPFAHNITEAEATVRICLAKEKRILKTILEATIRVCLAKKKNRISKLF